GELLKLGIDVGQTSVAKYMARRRRPPSQGWTTFLRNPEYLIHDRDRAYREVFTWRVRAMGIRDRPTSPRSPWQNAYAERLIGSIRRECVDHVVVLGERHLRHVLLSYMEYFNEARTHLSLNKDASIPRAVHAAGRILCRPILGGIASPIRPDLIFDRHTIDAHAGRTNESAPETGALQLSTGQSLRQRPWSP